MKVKQIDTATEKYPTDKTLSAKEIKVRKEFPQLNEYKQFLYIKNGDEVDEYKNYIKGTLQNIGYFENIYYRNDLEKIVISQNLTDKVTNISDNIGLLNLSKEIGKFLVLRTAILYKGGYSYEFEFELIDPTTAETIYKVVNPGFNWSGLDRPMFHPVFNDYAAWLEENK
ncbi:hypothetical protein [Luteirhabdus pelagi]|uniref:hypothetical protein n=1 Tax=Luteirhabdus pelagi TaxID=2792783 RepID=UPI00193A1A65|nr:hypothetical protein [Luteirhabdus pelagi]